jgi:hypothetical protein
MSVPISNVTRRQVYAPSGTGGAGPYAFTFEILANTDIAVFKDDTLLTLTTHYTVTINANGTGSVTITATGLALAPLSPTQYAIVGNRTISRTTDFTTGGDFFANTLNDELDQQTIFAQQNAEGVQRALVAPQTDPTSINMVMPRASVRANKALAFDGSGNPSLAISVTDIANAVTYAANAAASAAAAAASYDSFDDRYLGPKASAPTLDNDGNALLTGALYFDTTLNFLRVYNGTAWLTTAFTSVARTAITAFATQTVLTVANYQPGINVLSVYVNGVKLNASEYTETNSTTITLATGLALNDEVEVFSYQVNAVGSLSASSVTYIPFGAPTTTTNVQTKLQEIEGNAVSNFTGNGVTTTFTVAGFARSVYVAGIFQAPGTYTVASTTITFSQAPPVNAAIAVYTSLANPFGGTIYAAQISGNLPLTQTSGQLAVAQGGTGATATTGSGNNVLATSPTLVTPILGTPTSGTLTNTTGLPVATGISGLGTGVATFLATPSSANLRSALTDETGTGSAVFAAAPTLVGDVTLSTGNLVIGTAGKGIDFSATSSGSGTMTSELLADYEEGTWTPTQGAGLTLIGTFSSSGIYCKVGRVVTVTAQLTGSTSVATAGGGVDICAGLPFAAGTTSLGTAVGVWTAPTGAVIISTTVYASSAISAVSTIVVSATYQV